MGGCRTRVSLGDTIKLSGRRTHVSRGDTIKLSGRRTHVSRGDTIKLSGRRTHVSRGDTIKLSGYRTHRVSWGHVQTFMPFGHKEDKANARAGGDMSVQDGGCS